MAYTTPPVDEDSAFGLYLGRGLRGVGLWALGGLSLYLLLALMTYTPQDPGWSYAGPSNAEIHNIGGLVGAWLADVLLYLFGYFGFLFPLLIAWSGLLILQQPGRELSERIHILPLRWLGFVATLSAGAALADLYIRYLIFPLPVGPGGVLGQFLAESLAIIIDPLGGALLLFFLFSVGFTLFSGISWFAIMDRLGGWTLWILSPVLWLLRPSQPTDAPRSENIVAAPSVAEPIEPLAVNPAPCPGQGSALPAEASALTEPMTVLPALDSNAEQDAQLSLPLFAEPPALSIVDTSLPSPVVPNTAPVDLECSPQLANEPQLDRRIEPRMPVIAAGHYANPAPILEPGDVLSSLSSDWPPHLEDQSHGDTLSRLIEPNLGDFTAIGQDGITQNVSRHRVSLE
jgi:hypothetical protein